MSVRSSHPKVLCKKGVLKKFYHLFICILLKQKSGSGQKPVKICQNSKISKRALSSIFYFEKLLFFCRSINENVLEWFLLITSKEYTLYIH